MRATFKMDRAAMTEHDRRPSRPLSEGESEGEGATIHRLPTSQSADGTPAETPELEDSRELLERARQLEPAALRTFYDLHKERIAAQVQRMTGDPNSVDDLVQEIFIAAFSSIQHFRGESHVRTWLYRIATNKVRNWWDSNQRRRRREWRASMIPEESPPTPVEDLESSEHRERLYQAIGALPSKLREAFVARVIEGLSLQEASEALEVPISTVSYRTRRAEDLLCEALGLDKRA